MRIYVGAATGEWRLGFPDGSSGGILSPPSQQAEPETVEVCMGGCKYSGQFCATLMLPTLQLVNDPYLACPSCGVAFHPPPPGQSWDRSAAFIPTVSLFRRGINLLLNDRIGPLPGLLHRRNSWTGNACDRHACSHVPFAPRCGLVRAVRKRTKRALNVTWSRAFARRRTGCLGVILFNALINE